MSAAPAVPPWVPLEQLGLLAVLAVSLAAVRHLDGGGWGATLRRRLVMGVPWGTLAAAGFVLAVYVFVQGGSAHWNRPTVLPFRAWSYFYPLGVVVSGFAHNGPGHLLGNLTGALAFAPIAEYAWGHFPRERGAQTFSSLRTNPYARALAFAGGALAAGLLSGVFSVGPVVGFSGAVFALAGLALVRYPLATVVALAASDVLWLFYRALTAPAVVREAKPEFVTPWWAQVAIHGHALGLLFGVVVGVALLRRRGVRPAPGRIWLGALLFAVDQSLWAVYWFRGGQTFVLYRAAGTVLVLALAAVVAAGVAASDRPFVPAIDLAYDEAAVGLLVAVTLGLSLAAVPVNLATVADAGPPGETAVAVQDYTVSYAEDVPNRMVLVVNVSAFGETTRVNTSGVVVVSERRHIWTTAVSESRLAFAGRTAVRLGGLGWRRTVFVRRTGWTTVGGPAAYKVRLRPEGEPSRVAFASPPATAEPTLAGRNVSIEPTGDGFGIVVTRGNETLGRAPIPDVNRSVRVGGLRFDRTGQGLFAVHNETRVRVAKKETYRGQQT